MLFKLPQGVSSLEALRVPLVGSLARAGRAALSTVEALATALAVLGSAASTTSTGSRSRSGVVGSGLGSNSSGHGGGRGLLLDGSRATGGTAGPDLGTGHGESLAAVVDGEVGVGVGSLVGTGELDHGAGGSGTTTLDLDLKAGDVVLGLVDVGAVDTDVLETGEVLAVRGVLGDLGGDPVTVVVAPSGGGEVTTVTDTKLVDLEPVTGTVVGLDGARGLGEVDELRTRVLELGTDSELEADLLTGVDGQDLGVATVLVGTLVADDIGSIDVGVVTDVGRRVGGELDGVVGDRTGGLADVLEGRLLLTSLNVGVEEVMSRGHLGDGSEGESGNLHSDRAVMNVFKK